MTFWLTHRRKIFISVAVFVAINLLVFLLFLGRVYPNTKLKNYSVGGTSYGGLAKKISSLPLLPKTFTLNGQGRNFAVTPSQLGVSVDSQSIKQAAHKRSWLPVANLFAAHDLPVKYKVNQTALVHKISEIAASNQQPAIDAQISLQNNQFTLVSSKSGYQLNTTQAVKSVSKGVAKGNLQIKLPFTVTSPKVSDASLEPTLQQLRAQQGVALSFSYNGNTTQVAAPTIASWYASVNGQFQLQPTKIQAYINQLGASSGIHVANLSDLVSKTQNSLQKVTSASLTLVAVPTTICSPNNLSQLVIVSTSQQHMWACSTYNLVYDAPVVTGMQNYPADITPTGTFKIYSKQTNLFLTGSDSTGSWHEFVSYWMPFLTNQYGVYGFHDASWRANSDFGNISPASDNASHGCVELPTAAAQWLYSWAAKGTTVSINN